MLKERKEGKVREKEGERNKLLGFSKSWAVWELETLSWFSEECWARTRSRCRGSQCFPLWWGSNASNQLGNPQTWRLALKLPFFLLPFCKPCTLTVERQACEKAPAWKRPARLGSRPTRSWSDWQDPPSAHNAGNPGVPTLRSSFLTQSKKNTSKEF